MKRKGFTLIELIVVMAIISILALFGLPKYQNHTKDANLTRIKVNIKELETASNKYYMTHNSWPKLSDEPYTSEQLISYAEKIYDKTGKEVVLEESGNYYDIEYSNIDNYLKAPLDKGNYILRNPVGSIYYLENLTELGKESLGGVGKVVIPGPQPNEPVEGASDGVYTFHGEVKAENFITGNKLAEQIGLTEGIAQYSDEPWLKFTRKEVDGNVTTMFVAKKPLRYSISWDHINNVGAVFGTKTIEIDGQTYKVRLMKGALTDPSEDKAADRGAHGSEWNKMMLPIHEQAIDQIWAYTGYVEDNIKPFAHKLGSGKNGMYTDKDLLTHYSYGNGSYSWTQEVLESGSSFRGVRGFGGVSNSGWGNSGGGNSGRGWRPVLELVND